MSFAVLLKFVLQPQTEFDEWLKTESANTDLLAEILVLSLVPASRDAAAFPAMPNAPPWLRNLVSNLARVRRLSARITSHQYHDQTVFYLTSNLVSVLYDANGSVLCTLNFMEEKGDATEKCPEFNPHRNDGKPIWESRKQRN